MPLAVEMLNKQSSQETIDAAISSSYETCMSEKPNPGESVADHQKRCGGQIYGIARKQTGRPLKPNRGR